MSEPFLEVQDLHHTYNPDTPQAVVALDGISFDVEPGEYLGIIGGNGSGKSTLAKHLNALLLPTSGAVRVGGMDTRDRASIWEIRRRVGMVFQNPDNQLVATVVEEDVAFGPENLGLPPDTIRQRVDEALAAVEMTPFRRHAPHLLSGGQKQRIAIAGILAMRPECLVLDEATTMLDPAGRAEVQATVRALRGDTGMTVILVSHAMEDLVEADRIIALDEGRVIMDGSPGEVFDIIASSSGGRLDLPPMAKLARWLREDGIPVEGEAHTVESLARTLLSLTAGARRGRG